MCGRRQHSASAASPQRKASTRMPDEWSDGVSERNSVAVLFWYCCWSLLKNRAQHVRPVTVLRWDALRTAHPPVPQLAASEYLAPPGEAPVID